MKNTNKTRATRAMEYLKKKLPKDSDTNIGMNEAYRQGLEDMVNWIDIPIDIPNK